MTKHQTVGSLDQLNLMFLEKDTLNCGKMASGPSFTLKSVKIALISVLQGQN